MGHQQASNAARIQLYISALHKYSKDFASNPEQTMNEHKTQLTDFIFSHLDIEKAIDKLSSNWAGGPIT